MEKKMEHYMEIVAILGLIRTLKPNSLQSDGL